MFELGLSQFKNYFCHKIKLRICDRTCMKCLSLQLITVDSVDLFSHAFSLHEPIKMHCIHKWDSTPMSTVQMCIHHARKPRVATESVKLLNCDPISPYFLSFRIVMVDNILHVDIIHQTKYYYTTKCGTKEVYITYWFTWTVTKCFKVCSLVGSNFLWEPENAWKVFTRFHGILSHVISLWNPIKFL